MIRGQESLGPGDAAQFAHSARRVGGVDGREVHHGVTPLIKHVAVLQTPVRPLKTSSDEHIHSPLRIVSGDKKVYVFVRANLTAHHKLDRETPDKPVRDACLLKGARDGKGVG